MKNIKIFLFLIILSLVLTGCRIKEGSLTTNLNCNGNTCSFDVTNNLNRSEIVTVYLYEEAQGSKLREEFSYPNTTSQKHNMYLYAFNQLFSIHEEYAAYEKKTYEYTMNTGDGLSLFKVKAQTEPTNFFTSERGISETYHVLNFNNNIQDIDLNLTCNKEIKATVSVFDKQKTVEIGIYLNSNLELPYMQFTAKDFTEAHFYLPENTGLVEMDILGHQNDHKYRTYCVPLIFE